MTHRSIYFLVSFALAGFAAMPESRASGRDPIKVPKGFSVDTGK